MKKFLCFKLLLLAASCAFAQANVKGHKWQVTLKAIDENGEPVTNADVDIWYYVKAPPGQTEAPEKMNGLTDKDGVFVASHEDTGSVTLGFQVKKTGCYASTAGYTLGMSYQYDPAKWSPEINIVLKTVGKPIAMYAKSIISFEFPVFNKPIGYDLMAGDWVAPYGKGSTSDFLFTENHPDAKSGYTFAVDFPHPGDGIQEFSAPALIQDAVVGQSDLRSLHEAPIDGYQPKLEQTNGPDLNRNYYFRVRTVLDANGNVRSALYGKIYGDFMQFRYFLNPTPNDKNVEFDPKHNLLGGLKSFERVSAP